MFHRRDILAGLAALSALPARGATSEPLFTTGPLAENPVARMFRRVPANLDPDPVLLGADGPTGWQALRGKPHLVTLWAEWCAPCLAEAGEFARLAAAYHDRKVGVVGILTGSAKHLDFPSAAALMARMRAQELPIWIEPAGGAQLLKTVAQLEGQSSLPCNLIVDAAGRIRGRAFGSQPLAPPVGAFTGRRLVTKKVLTEVDKARMLAQPPPTVWSTPAATQLMDALAAGAV